jgi:hypothetical protein
MIYFNNYGSNVNVIRRDKLNCIILLIILLERRRYLYKNKDKLLVIILLYRCD